MGCWNSMDSGSGLSWSLVSFPTPSAACVRLCFIRSVRNSTPRRVDIVVSAAFTAGDGTGDCGKVPLQRVNPEEDPTMATNPRHAPLDDVVDLMPEHLGEPAVRQRLRKLARE